MVNRQVGTTELFFLVETEAEDLDDCIVDHETCNQCIDNGEEAAKYEIAAAKCYVDDTIAKIEHWAKRLICYVETGDTLKTQLAAVKKLASYQPIDTITLKKEIAERVIDLEAYPFFDV